MLTLDEIILYKEYNGDPTWMAKSDRGKEKDWDKIGDLVLHLSLVKAGLASEDLRIKTEKELSEQVESDEARDFLKSLAK